MTQDNAVTLEVLAGPGGVSAGSGLGSATSWAIAVVVLVLLAAVAWWRTTGSRRRR